MSKKDDKKLKHIIIITIVTIILAGAGLSISKHIPELWKSYLRTGGVIFTFFGFLLMLFSGYEQHQNGKEFINLHPAVPWFRAGLIVVFLGFVSQILGK